MILSNAEKVLSSQVAAGSCNLFPSLTLLLLHAQHDAMDYHDLLSTDKTTGASRGKHVSHQNDTDHISSCLLNPVQIIPNLGLDSLQSEIAFITKHQLRVWPNVFCELRLLLILGIMFLYVTLGI